MPARRILIAGLLHETHSFLPETTPLSAFRTLNGRELLACRGDGSPLDGFLETAARFGWEVIPTVDLRAMPSGPVEDAVLEYFWSRFEAAARPALARGVDAIYLVLHGAMFTQSFLDLEGEVLARIRALPGAAGLPVFGVFDLHANFSPQMAALSDGLFAYRKNPHSDAKQAAIRAAEKLEETLNRGDRVRTFYRAVPLIYPPPATATDRDPMRALATLAAEIEAADPDVLGVNVIAGFAFADTPFTGVSFTVITRGGEEAAQRYLAALAHRAWELRELARVRYPTADEVLGKLGRVPAGPVLLVEPADNIGGGAPGDGTGVLRAILQHRPGSAVVIINDPLAVQATQGLALGTTRHLEIGGRAWPGDAGPVSLECRLISRSDGRFTLEDAQSHLASLAGVQIDMGPCAVVRHANVTILLTSRKTPPFDLGQLRSQGLEPSAFALIGVKAAVAHERAYNPIARASYLVDTPGPCTSSLEKLPYRRLTRPIYPLDPENLISS